MDDDHDPVDPLDSSGGGRTASRPARALVCGGGGMLGLAWMTGFLVGAREIGMRLADDDHVIGTSAGAVAATLARTPKELEAAFGRLTGASPDHGEAAPPRDGFSAAVSSLRDLSRHEARYEQAVLDLSMDVEDDALIAASRRRTIRHRIGAASWPTGVLVITTFSRPHRRRRLLTSRSGVELVDALAASCAVPGTWPPVRIPDGDVCIDAGPFSATHADLACSAERVVILRPTANLQGDLPAEADVLERALVVEPRVDAGNRASLSTAARDGWSDAHRRADALLGMWEG